MKTIKKNYSISAKPEKVIKLLTDPREIEKWTGSPAKMDVNNGGFFSLWEGSIHGINRQITKNQIIQDWKENNWENFSKVTMNIQHKGDKTEIELIQEDIPDDSADSINSGWDEYYFGPLKELAETSD